MSTYSKVDLSGSTRGKGIKVAANATPGTVIHTTGTSSSDKDEVWIYVTNSDASPVGLTLEWGGTTSPDDLIQVSIPAKAGLTLVVPGLVLRGDGSSGAEIRAFATGANKLVIFGSVNRIA